MAAATGTAPLLAQARDRARETDRDDGVEQADVDPQLEGVGGGDAEQLAGREALLDLSPLRGCVAGAVGREAAGVAEPVCGKAVDQLRGLAALCEKERSQVARDELSEHARALAEWRCAQPEFLIRERRVPEHDRPLR